MLNVRHVELFWYVVTHRGVTPALPHVPGGVGRSTINEAMHSLRTALGGKLYEGDPFVLLPRGAQLMAIADPFFRSLGHLLQRAAERGDRQLRIACSRAVLPYLDDIFNLLNERYPALEVETRAASQLTMLQMLSPGLVDLVIAPIDGPVQGRVHCTRLVGLQLALLVHKHSPHQSAKEFWAQPDKLPRLAVPATSESIVGSFQRGTARLGVHWRPAWRSDDLLSVQNFVGRKSVEVGLTLDVPPCVEHPDVRVLRLEGFEGLDIGVYRTRPFNELGTLLVKVLQRRAELTFPGDGDQPLGGHSRVRSRK